MYLCNINNKYIIIPLWVPPSLPTLPWVQGCRSWTCFFPFNNTGSPVGVFGMDSGNSHGGVSFPNPVSHSLSLYAGDAGGRLGGRQDLFAGALQGWRFPGRQLHFHGWNRLQGKCSGGSLAPSWGLVMSNKALLQGLRPHHPDGCQLRLGTI